MKKEKVIIIGAGPAGITAGYELAKHSDQYEVIVLEETDQLGGISRTEKYKGNRMDIGGHRFFSKDRRVMDWWKQLMPLQGSPSFDDKLLSREVELAEGGPDPDQADRVMLTRKRVSRIYYKKKFFDYPVKLNVNTIRNMGFLVTVRAGFGYLAAVVHKRKECSLEDFYINRFGRVLYSMFFEGYTEKLWGRHPGEISADWGAQRVKGLSITAIFKDVVSKLLPGGKREHIETSLIEQFSYPKYGPGQLWEIAAEDMERMGGSIRKNCRVTGVRGTHGRITSVTYETPEGICTEQADYVISSMPLKDLIRGMEAVPDSIKRIAEGLPYRDFVTVGILLKKMKLKNETKLKTLNHLVPDCWIYIQDTGVRLGRIQIFNNWSPYLVAKPEETVWIGLEYFCSEGDTFWRMSEEEWAHKGIQELTQMGVIDGEMDVLDFHCVKVKKAYPAYFDTYSEIHQLIHYLDEFENLYCVGRNGQHRYNNMDHSMATSFEAVDNILHGKKEKDNVWNVNTEQEFHEEKQE
ncbi:MAG: NAD(P)/FAD-dependent oxidoreductase [Lachnospiraceae bacterium]|nr:NAD(P)/FAD-dependent oxidoreductase [Lachnospiraceae bacterium]